METQPKRKLRYAVVGLGYISQIAVLPAFAHAKNCELVALVSSDRKKLKALAEKYGVENTFTYDEYDRCLESGIDAVYIATPNSLHHEYTLRAAKKGVHVLCEKPMATSERECREMIETCQRAEVKLMVAYRLHFEESNLKAIELANSGPLGELRLFSSVFTSPVNDRRNSRLKAADGGGPLWDIGIYCLNAARNIFRAEPIEVVGLSAASDDSRFTEVPETFSATLRFPQERTATFVCNFSGASHSSYRVIGTRGDLLVSPAYDFAGPHTYLLTIDEKTQKKSFPQRDQFAPELIYFSDCVLENKEPEPSGQEGLADVRVIEALHESALTRQVVSLSRFEREQRPDLRLQMRLPAVKEPELINAHAPH